MGLLGGGGIFHPTIANRFKVRYIFSDSAHNALTMQTIRVDYDLTAKTLDIVIEMPLGNAEAMDDLIQFAQGKSSFGFTDSNTCVVIDYLTGQDMEPAHSVHCFIDEVLSTKIGNDYAATGTTKIYVKCKVRNFMTTHDKAFGK